MTTNRKLIKLATAGSVDDGKSTLIGRLLYDTRSLTTDKLEAIERSSRQRGFDYLDFSLATDGLVAEREQGITIDVAHIYFNTQRTNFIIADTPGHAEYTRNMVTGASTSDVAIILIDVRKGVTEQTRRHFFISNLLKMRHVVVAVNKMDLAGYDERAFTNIRQTFERLVAGSDFDTTAVTYIPLAALLGDNIAQHSVNMPWYPGPHLLEHLESLDIDNEEQELPPRLPVQYVIRPRTAAFHDFRAFAGMLYGGSLSVGDEVTLLPSQVRTSIRSIHFYNESYQQAAPGNSITIELADEADISRGDMIVKTSALPQLLKSLTATLCQVNSRPLRVGDKCCLQHGVHRVLAKIESIEARIYTDFSGEEPTDTLLLNDIGRVVLRLSKPIHCDPYSFHRSNGSFILIDENSHDTLSVGFIQ
jgi:sulfate adenylyltransferase subunit 1